MAEDIFVILCNQADYDFLLRDYESIKISVIEEFELPPDTVVKIQRDNRRKAGRVRTYFNKEYFGDIVIQDYEQLPDRGLH